jgi:archaellum component FlaG (FlaF/FlaG flagellin family)
MNKTLNILVGFPLFAIMIMSCATTKPDLVPKDISFDSDNVLEVTFENQGKEEIPANKGNISIFIDGDSKGGYELGNLSDQSFRSVGSTYTIRTNFRLAGEDRRIGFALDTYDEIDEANELQNTYTRTVDPPAISGPDFTVSDLLLNSSSILRIEVKNIGNASSPANLDVRIRVIVDESVVADLTPTLPALSPGGSTTITPSSPITVSSGSEVRVLLNTNNLLDEIDNMNNVREEILPGGPSYSPYTTLLSNPKISSNIIWENSGGVNTYSSWSTAQKNDFRDAVLRLERELPQEMTSPPTLVGSNDISAADAWQIYIQHVAQSLWIEKNNLVSWDIVSFTDDQLSYLLDSRKLLHYNAGTNRYTFSTHLMGSATAWNPQINYRFLSNYDFVKNNQTNTIYALTEWMRAHLRHISGSDEYIDLYGYEGLPPTDKILYPLEGEDHITAGCWGTSGFYASVLRSINIPVEHARTQFGSSNATHSRPYFPTIDLSMPHADDVYNATFVPSGIVVPISDLFYTSTEMDNKFISPSLDCDGSDCNTIGEQASYNSGRDHIANSWDYFGDFLLYQYAQYGESYVRGSLKGPRIGGSVVEYAKPYFNASERDTMIDQIESYLTSLGDGDIEAGKDIVTERYTQFLQNK